MDIVFPIKEKGKEEEMMSSNLRGEGEEEEGAIKFEKLPHLIHQLVQDEDEDKDDDANKDDTNKKKCSYRNPLEENHYFHPSQGFFVSDYDVVLRHTVFDLSKQKQKQKKQQKEEEQAYYLRAGPRRNIYFDTSSVRAAIVTCGGLCPGMNTVIRELVVGLWDLYGVRNIYGIKAGYRGFYSPHLQQPPPAAAGYDAVGIGGIDYWSIHREKGKVLDGGGGPVLLEPKVVHDWHKRGGTLLQTSRGGFHLHNIVDAIQHHAFNQVYIIGGDGAMRGAVKIFEEISRRKLQVAVVGIPKTVDNDVGIIDRSFGFQTAVEMAQQAVHAAHVEAESAVNGIGLVKLMGRSSGHIALHATLSSRDVDCCLIPENDFYLHGKGGLFHFLEHRLKQNGHAVVVVAEGAGQDMIPRTDSQKEERDESGNPVFLDVGVWLKSELKKWWEREHPDELFTVKYIDPTYMIRAVPANATDNLYCTLLAHSAIHGVMAGYTGYVAGPINGNYAYIPMKEVAEAKNPVDIQDHKWAWVRSVNNQPDFMKSAQVPM